MLQHVADRLTISVEPFSRALFDEVVPLARKCWQESTAQKLKTCAFYGERDFDVDPVFELYERMAPALLGLMLRDEAGQLVGYLIGMIYESWHHKSIPCANVDNMYIEPQYRGYARTLIHRFEKELTERGVQVIGWPTTQGSPLYALLDAMGFVGDDIVMEKRLCA